MATVYLCDRCGKVIKPTGLLNLMKSKIYMTKVEYIPAILSEGSWEIGKSKILCDDCGLSFSKWWSMDGEKKEEST